MKNLGLIFIGIVCLILASCGSKSDGDNSSSSTLVKAQEGANDDHNTNDACYENYTFHKESSTITIGFDAVKSHPNCYCSSHTCSDTEVAFRFYNGTLELDLSNRGLFDQNLGRHAITQQYCTTALTDPNCESFYEQWRSCTIGINCSL